MVNIGSLKSVVNRGLNYSSNRKCISNAKSEIALEIISGYKTTINTTKHPYIYV